MSHYHHLRMPRFVQAIRVHGTSARCSLGTEAEEIARSILIYLLLCLLSKKIHSPIVHRVSYVARAKDYIVANFVRKWSSDNDASPGRGSHSRKLWISLLQCSSACVEEMEVGSRQKSLLNYSQQQLSGLTLFKAMIVTECISSHWGTMQYILFGSRIL